MANPQKCWPLIPVMDSSHHWLLQLVDFMSVSSVFFLLFFDLICWTSVLDESGMWHGTTASTVILFWGIVPTIFMTFRAFLPFIRYVLLCIVHICVVVFYREEDRRLPTFQEVWDHTMHDGPLILERVDDAAIA